MKDLLEKHFDPSYSACPFYQFLKDTSTKDGELNTDNLFLKIRTIGYLLCGYKSRTDAKAVLCVGPQKSGKTTFANLFHYLKRGVICDARLRRNVNFSMEDAKYDVLCLDDANDRANDLSCYFDYITGDFLLKRGGRIPFDQSPKLLITMNNIPDRYFGQPSYTERIHLVEFYHNPNARTYTTSEMICQPTTIEGKQILSDFLAHCVMTYNATGI